MGEAAAPLSGDKADTIVASKLVYCSLMRGDVNSAHQI